MVRPNDLNFDVVLRIDDNKKRVDYWRTVMGGFVQESRLHHVSGIRNDHLVVSSKRTRITVHQAENLNGPIVKVCRMRILWCCPHCLLEIRGNARCKKHIRMVHENHPSFRCTKPGCTEVYSSKHDLEQVRYSSYMISLFGIIELSNLDF